MYTSKASLPISRRRASNSDLAKEMSKNTIILVMFVRSVAAEKTQEATRTRAASA
jgi:hypothetical protein